MALLGQDLKYAIRRSARTPGFTIAAIATLALGLGLNSAVSSLAYAIFARPLPLDGADRLVLVAQTLPNRPRHNGYPLSLPDYQYYQAHAQQFEGLAAHYATSPMQIASRDFARGVMGSVVTANYFDVLHLQPAIGRFFDAEEDRVPDRDPVAIISDDLWSSAFARDPNVLGSNLRVNGTVFQIIGVTPEGFRGIVRGLEPAHVYIPTAMFSVGYRYCDGFARTCRVVGMVGRLRPDASIDDAQAEVDVLAAQLEAKFPDTNRGRGAVVTPARGIRDQAQRAPMVALLGAAAILVLLVASANVAGLLLARGLRRRKEIAIRLALGASRARLIRQLLVESVLLSTAGGAAGLFVAIWATEILRGFFGMASDGAALNLDLSLHPGIVAITFVVAAATGVLTGIAPALQSTRADTLPALKDETAGASGRRSRLRDGLIVCQVAMSVLLLVSSALLVQSFFRLQRGPGFDPKQLVLMRLRPSLLGYNAERAWAFQREVLRRLETIPGVIVASPSNVVPLPRWGRPPQPVSVVGGDATDDARAFQSSTTNVGTRHFKTLGDGLIEGREFDDRDTPTSPRVAILNEAVASRLFPTRGAVGVTGRRILVGKVEHEIVGVVRDLQFVATLEQPEPIVYLNYWQQNQAQAWSLDSVTHVRITGNAAAIVPEIRRTIAAIDPDVPVGDVQQLSERLNFHFSEVHAARALLLIFGTLALVLSAIGLYAALAFAVAQRSKEIAIRMALGAARGQVRLLVLRHGFTIVSIGAIIGMAAAAATGPLLAHLLYGVSPRDPLALVAGPAALIIVAFLAIWMPARRATVVDPVVALRTE